MPANLTKPEKIITKALQHRSLGVAGPAKG
jgi:hypothetical protein